MGALFLLPWVCLSLYCSCHPNSCYNRHCKTRGRVVHTTETRFGNIEIRQQGTSPFQDYMRRKIFNDTHPNPQPMYGQPQPTVSTNARLFYDECGWSSRAVRLGHAPRLQLRGPTTSSLLTARHVKT